MSETIIEHVLTNKLQTELLIKWLNSESIEDAPEDCILHCCARSEFAAYFLSYLRNHTEAILQANTNSLPVQHQQTPEKFLNSRRKHRRSISDPTNEADRSTDSVKCDKNRSHESPNRDKKRGRKVKTKLFADEKNQSIQSVSSDESRLNSSFDKLALSSTPLKNGHSPKPNFVTSPVTPQSKSFKEFERCDTPRLYRPTRAHDKSVSLGDFIINAPIKSSKKKRSSKNVSSENEDIKPDLDISNSEVFPEIGARKASSLKSDRRRIKPTNLDIGTTRKSFSLTSFNNSECFQPYSPLALEDNSFFKQQSLMTNKSENSFETERNILKLERHKLMEKFNILNTSVSPKTPSTPIIKIFKNESIEKNQEFINTDPAKVKFKEQIDLLVELYDVLLKNNLVLSIVSEIYFLISIILSKQFEDDYNVIEAQMNNNNLYNYLLKSINNSTYFAVKSLWNLRTILEGIIDKNSLKILGENKKIRAFCPELAKSLLNCYGLKVEAENNRDKSKNVLEGRSSNGIVCFNFETDNIDNFPSALSFQTFKKQRDMFYEIVRWYSSESGSVSLSALRGRCRAVLCAGCTTTNSRRVAALLATHLLEHCVHAHPDELKMDKLKRRLISPSAPESRRLPHFSGKEVFYKEFILCTDNESFRVNLKDALASEVIALDASHISTDEKANTTETSKDFFHLSKKLILLAKFLGFVTSLPYCQVTAELTAKSQVTNIGGHLSNLNPKEKVLDNDLALRNYSQPCIDINGLLISSIQNNRLIITLPWIIEYLSMLDFTTLRTKYYQHTLKTLFHIYTKLLYDHKQMHKNTVLFLKIKLGWLYDLPQMPHSEKCELSDLTAVNVSDMSLDALELVNEAILMELCPYLKDIGVLLSTCRVSREQKESFRHITPNSLSNEDRIRNKDMELQKRLEEELLKSQPSSTRKVLEMIIERVTSSTIRELTMSTLVEARERAREKAAVIVQSNATMEQPAVIQLLQALYNAEISSLLTNCMNIADNTMKSRVSRSVSSLVPLSPSPLRVVAYKLARSRLHTWITEHWGNTNVLCGDIEQQYRSLLDHPHTNITNNTTNTKNEMSPTTSSNLVSVANTIIQIKEQICLLLERRPTPQLSTILSTARLAVHQNNVFCIKSARNAVLQLTVDLCVVFVSRRPQEITESLLTQLHLIWDTICPDRKHLPSQDDTLPDRRDISPIPRNFDEDEQPKTPTSDEDDKIVSDKIVTDKIVTDKIVTNKIVTNKIVTNKIVSVSDKIVIEPINIANNSVNSVENSEFLDYFDRILCPRNIMVLSDGPSEVWSVMARVLVFLLKHQYLSEDSLTEQCLAVYRHDWPQNILENVSACMRQVSSHWRHAAGKFTLFLDFLAEFCGNMDYEHH